jgi:hypothetical protein
MLGGFKFPLAWMLTFVIAIITTYPLTFVCFRYSSDSERKLSTAISILFLGILVSLVTGYLFAGLGVAAGPSQDPSGGKFSLARTLFWSGWGTLSGFCVGVGTLRWIAALTTKVGLERRSATTLSVLAACITALLRYMRYKAMPRTPCEVSF